MSRHPFAIWALFFLMLFGFLFGFITGSPYIAGLSLIVGIVLIFVMGIAWVRFRGGPTEHHPRIDKIVDDTRP